MDDDNRPVFAVIVVLSVLIIVAFASVGWMLYRSHRDTCNSRDVALAVIRNLLVDSEATTLARRDVSPEEARLVREFYNRQFARIDKAHCN